MNRKEKPVKENKNAIKIFCTGILQMPKDAKEQKHDYFKYVKDIFQKSDFTIGYLDRQQIGKEWREKYIEQLKNAGYHYLVDIDGVRTDMVGIKGIKIGILNYTSITIDDAKNQIFGPEDAKEDIKKLKKMGANYVIMYIYWGAQSGASVTPKQKYFAKEFVGLGVDLIVGVHPKLVEPVCLIEGPSDEQVLCAYSLGYFHSEEEAFDKRRSFILVLKLESNGKTINHTYGYIPTMTYRRDFETKHCIMPAEETLVDVIEPKYIDETRDDITDKLGKDIKEVKNLDQI